MKTENVRNYFIVIIKKEYEKRIEKKGIKTKYKKLI